MNKSIIKKVILFVSALLVVISLAGIYATRPPDESFLKQARGGWAGPCLTINDHCGGLGGGSAACNAAEDCGAALCPAECPSGSPDKVCQNTSGGCSHQMVKCSTMIRSTCKPIAAGCDCFETGVGTCSRQKC
jgi:hypothetical protein